MELLERREMLSGNPAVTGLSTVVPDLSAAAALTALTGFDQAALVVLSATGSGTRTGSIEQAYGEDFFRFIATVSGRMTLRQSATVGSELDSFLYVYNAGKSLLAQNDDSGATLDSMVQIAVTARQTYYVKAAASGASTGDYKLTFSTSTDDFGNAFADAALVTIAASGSATRTGKINYAGDVDMFRFVATVTGKMTIRQSAAVGSTLDSHVYAYSASQAQLAHNDDSGGSLDSAVQISVVKGRTYYVKATAFGASIGAYVLRFSTVAGVQPPPAAGKFQIDLTVTGLTATQERVVQQAADRWERIVVGDLPSARYEGRAIDDLWIEVVATPIDGVGGTLAEGGVTAERSRTFLPYAGSITLDSDDLADIIAQGAFLGVLEHEMGHILGIGTEWESLGLLSGAGTKNPIFTGPQATAQYNSLFHTTAKGVPVEATGGLGTALSHWRDSVLDNELLTGWYNYGQRNPISRITVASLADMGYQVDLSAADSYSPPAAVRAAAAGAAATGSTAARDLAWLPDAQSVKRKLVDRVAMDRVLAAGDWGA